MNTKKNTMFLTVILSIFWIGCSSTETDNNLNLQESSNTSSMPANTAENGAFNDERKTPTPEEKVAAVTLTPVVEAYCSAMRKGDETGLRKVYSKATLRSFDEDARADGVTLLELLSTEPVGDKCQVVNERIQGNLGEALVITKTYPNGIMIKFVKEGEDWKMTNQSSDFDAVRKSAGK